MLLGSSWGSWCDLGGLLGVLGSSWRRPGAVLNAPGAVLASKMEQKSKKNDLKIDRNFDVSRNRALKDLNRFRPGK